MSVLAKLYKKRNDALAVYRKWQSLIDTLESDPDFASVTHGRAVKAMNGARARLATDAAVLYAQGLPDADGAALPPLPLPDAPRRKKYKPWSKARRADQAERMRNRWKNPKTRPKLLAAAAKGNRAKKRAARQDA